MFRRKSAAQFFSNVHVYFVLRHRSGVQFLVVFMSVLCSVVKLLFGFFVFVNFSNVHVCFVFRRVHFLYISICVSSCSVFCIFQFH